MKRRISWVLLFAVGLASPVFAAVTLEREMYARSETAAGEEPVLTVHFIDVGGGDGILIDTPSHKKILIDGGWTWGDRGIVPEEYGEYLDEFLGDDVVDLIIVSHPDCDHFLGLLDVLDRYVVRQMWYTGYDSEELSTSWRNFMDKVEEEEDLLFVSPVCNYFGLGSEIRFDDSETYTCADDVVLTLINAKQWLKDEAYGSANNRKLREDQRRNSSSLVVRLDYGPTSFLFTGDTNGRDKNASDVNQCDDQELFMVLNNENQQNPLYGRLACTVLKVPHHGSNGSSSLRFLQAVHPEWAVISAGVHHGHPTAGALERLKCPEVGLDEDHILRTDQGDNKDKATPSNIGDDCYRMIVDLAGIAKIEKWNVK